MALCLCVLSSCANTSGYLKASVLSVSDGDTLVLVLDNGRKIRARLYGVDAPEKKQAYGAESQENLKQLCDKRYATIDLMAADRYGRIVVQIICGGVNVNIDQLGNGLAWVYDDYIDDEQILIRYNRAQATAKEKESGLWIEKEPIPPWEYRRGKR